MAYQPFNLVYQTEVQDRGQSFFSKIEVPSSSCQTNIIHDTRVEFLPEKIRGLIGGIYSQFPSKITSFGGIYSQFPSKLTSFGGGGVMGIIRCKSGGNGGNLRGKMVQD